MASSQSHSMSSDALPQADTTRSGDGDQRPAKRQKVAIACDECRAKKAKCDGSKPARFVGLRAGLACGNESPAKASALTTETSLQFVVRARNAMDSRLCVVGALARPRSNVVSKADISRLEQRLKELESGRQLVTPQDHGVPRASLPHVQNQAHQREDEIGAMRGISPEEAGAGSHDYFADSSATSFINQVTRTINEQNRPLDSPRPSASISAHVQRSLLMSRTQNQKRSLDYVLPPRKKADELLETYWRLVDPLYPFLDKAEIMAAYQCIWIGQGPGYDEPTFLCLLNAMFCLACALGESIKPQERTASAGVFFLRARDLLDFDIVRHTSVLTVQCLLVLGQYLQSTNEPQECWTFVGLAVRAAQSLGLHQPSRTGHIQDIDKRDVLRRVWHGCVLMDRALAMTFGRPTMISSQAAAAVPPPLAHQDLSACYCSGANQSREEIPTDHHFFLESLKLYEILNEILLALYSGPPEQDPVVDPYEIYFSHSSGTNPAAIFDLDRKLLRWSRNIPVHLRTDQDAGKHPSHIRQANVLWLRFRHIRILLFRPILSLFCTRRGKSADALGDTMPERIARQCSIMCIELAQEVVEFFQSRLGTQSFDSFLPAWWYNVLYVYTAATVLVAARISPSITAEISIEALTASWEGAMEVLKRFEAFSKNTESAIATLRVLYDKSTQQQRQIQNQAVQQLHATYSSDSTGQSSMSNSDVSALSNKLSRVVDSRPVNSSLAIPVSGSSTNESLFQPTNGNSFDPANFWLDANDMSWLSSVPFQFYSDWDLVNGTYPENLH